MGWTDHICLLLNCKQTGGFVSVLMYLCCMRLFCVMRLESQNDHLLRVSLSNAMLQIFFNPTWCINTLLSNIFVLFVCISIGITSQDTEVTSLTEILHCLSINNVLCIWIPLCFWTAVEFYTGVYYYELLCISFLMIIQLHYPGVVGHWLNEYVSSRDTSIIT